MLPGQISHKRILYGVLDWGLGHAARSSVLINQLLAQGNSIYLVSSGRALAYLQHCFPALPFHNLDTAPVVYPGHSRLWINMVLQQRKIAATIAAEQVFVKQYTAQHAPDIIISDNCYGLYSNRAHSIMLTHQLNIQAPFFEKLVQKKIHRLLKPFAEIWVPDLPGNHNLAGKLARPVSQKLPPVSYTGPLSAFTPYTLVSHDAEKHYAYCAVISGPEKQRTLFENQVMDFLTVQNKPAIVVRGITAPRPLQRMPAPHITILDFLTGEDLYTLIMQSETIIARSGYTTLMDLHCLQKPALLLPTPGQTEQEYLFAKHVKSMHRNLHRLRPVTIVPCVD